MASQFRLSVCPHDTAKNLLGWFTRNTSLQVLGESKDGQAFHCFTVGPAWADKREAVQRVLCGMRLDPAGQRVLKDLQFLALEPVDATALDALGELMSR